MLLSRQVSATIATQLSILHEMILSRNLSVFLANDWALARKRLGKAGLCGLACSWMRRLLLLLHFCLRCLLRFLGPKWGIAGTFSQCPTIRAFHTVLMLSTTPHLKSMILYHNLFASLSNILAYGLLVWYVFKGKKKVCGWIFFCFFFFLERLTSTHRITVGYQYLILRRAWQPINLFQKGRQE